MMGMGPPKYTPLVALMDSHKVPASRYLIAVLNRKRITGWREVHLCPGCGAWSLEAPAGFGSGVEMAQAEEAANDHRAECPAFDMLAGLAAPN